MSELQDKFNNFKEAIGRAYQVAAELEDAIGRVDKALDKERAEPVDYGGLIDWINPYSNSPGRMAAPPGHQFAKSRYGRLLRRPDIGETFLSEDGRAVKATIYGNPARLILIPDAEKEPDIWARIERIYFHPFTQLDPGPEHLFEMDGVRPVLRPPLKGEWYFCGLRRAEQAITDDNPPRLILRPAKRIVFVEDPKGKWFRTKYGYMNMICDGNEPALRFRREESK